MKNGIKSCNPAVQEERILLITYPGCREVLLNVYNPNFNEGVVEKPEN
jgi:hypothetical protein